MPRGARPAAAKTPACARSVVAEADSAGRRQTKCPLINARSQLRDSQQPSGTGVHTPAQAVHLTVCRRAAAHLAHLRDGEVAVPALPVEAQDLDVPALHRGVHLRKGQGGQ